MLSGVDSAAGTDDSGFNAPVYLWPVAAVAVLGILITFVLSIALCVVKRKKKVSR